MRMELKTVSIEKPADINFILGQSHFTKTIEDMHEAIVQTVPQMKFGICESSGPALVRWTGNDGELLELARRNALALSCGHCFIVFMSGGFPINIPNTIKAVPEVCTIYCATAKAHIGPRPALTLVIHRRLGSAIHGARSDPNEAH
jgi:adenosine/AMP kinase